MCYLLLMTVTDCFYHLLEEEAGKILGQSFSSSNVRLQITANAHLHHEAHVVFRVKRVI